MEVKIKNGNEMLDATIEMINGVMVVSPNEVKYTYKVGEVIFVMSRYKHIIIYKESKNGYLYSFADLIEACLDIDDTPVCEECDIMEIRPATEEEKKLLFDKLVEEGYEWRPDTKELVKLKWKPKEGGAFWRPYSNSTMFAPTKEMFNIGRDKRFLDNGWCFKTEQECQEFCNRLNEAINSVNP